MLAEIDVGRVVAGKYELVRLIGKGAIGEVWLATHDSLGGQFAIKLVKPSDDKEDETAAGRFQLEAQISAKLSRKTRHIVSVSDHGEEEGLAYLVMELLEGESLEARLKGTGALSLAETTAIVMQIARAIGQAHAAGICHRDLKPANVFLTKDEDGRLLVKLLDFGIARSEKPFRTRSPFATGKDMVLGTPSYMSPEQARGLDTLDHRCDLWALAVVGYESLTRRIPWDGTTVEDIFLSICTHRVTPILSRRPDLPPAIEELFSRAFATKLEARFETAEELSGAFEALVDPAEVEAATRAPSWSAGTGERELPTSPNPSSGSASPIAMVQTPGGAHGTERMIATSGAIASVPVPMLRVRSGWIVLAAATFAILGIALIAARALGPRDSAASALAPGVSATRPPSSSDRASAFPLPASADPAAPSVATQISPAPTHVAPTSTAAAPTSATSAAMSRARGKGFPHTGPPGRAPGPPVASPRTTTPSAAGPPPVAPAPSGPPAPTTNRTPPDKSEVF